MKYIFNTFFIQQKLLWIKRHLCKKHLSFNENYFYYIIFPPMTNSGLSYVWSPPENVCGTTINSSTVLILNKETR